MRLSRLARGSELAIRWGWRTDNPCRGIERNPEQKRKRYLTGDELKRPTAALAATPDRQFVNAVMLLVPQSRSAGNAVDRPDAHQGQGNLVKARLNDQTEDRPHRAVVGTGVQTAGEDQEARRKRPTLWLRRDVWLGAYSPRAPFDLNQR